MELEALEEAIRRVLQVYPSEIHLDSVLTTDLGADSIDLVQMLKFVEEKLNVSFGDTDLDRLVTVEDVLNFIKRGTKHE